MSQPALGGRIDGTNVVGLQAASRSRAMRRRRRLASRSKQADPAATTAGDDAVRMYLTEIGDVGLLTSSEEIELAIAVQAGLAAAETMADANASQSWAKMDIAEQRRLRQVVVDGDRAGSDLTRANLRLVVSVAKRYLGRGMALLDLIQEGNLGLMKAVHKFDPHKGFKFSTYATWWIRQSISRSVADQSRTIRVPVHMTDSMNRVVRTQRQMSQDLRRNPTIAELAQECGMNETKVNDILVLATKQVPVSLDSPVGAEDDFFLSDVVADVGAAPADIASKSLMRASIEAVLEKLGEREADVLRMRFGLDGGQAKTLEEVGNFFGVTRERIRQIESKTLAKLRHPLRADGLRDFLYN